VVPPDAATVVLNAVPTVAPGSEVVERVNALVPDPVMTRLKAAVTVCWGEEESLMVRPTE
jgi:hypothetical protein